MSAHACEQRGGLASWRNSRQHANYFGFCFSALGITVLCWTALCWTLRSNPVNYVLQLCCCGGMCVFVFKTEEKESCLNAKATLKAALCLILVLCSEQVLCCTVQWLPSVVAHLQACFMPQWLFLSALILLVVWNVLSMCAFRSEEKDKIVSSFSRPFWEEMANPEGKAFSPEAFFTFLRVLSL